MELKYRIFDVTDESQLKETVRLHGVVNQSGMTMERMKQIIQPFGDREGRQPLLMGCYDGDRQVGFNLFIPMDFSYQGKKILGFQSGFTSTDPEYRRRGIFNNLQVNAREELADRGGRFVFGFPGPNSHPLFVKLGFSDYAYEKIFLPRFFWKSKLAAGNSFNERSKDAVLADEKAVYAWKKNMSQHPLTAVEHGNSFAWGIRSTVKKGPIGIPIFELCGFHLARREDLSPFVEKMFAETGAWALRLELYANDPHHGLFKGWAPVPKNIQIYYPLGDMPREVPHGFGTGIRDTF
jgi:hypothetical protein